MTGRAVTRQRASLPDRECLSQSLSALGSHRVWLTRTVIFLGWLESQIRHFHFLRLQGILTPLGATIFHTLPY